MSARKFSRDGAIAILLIGLFFIILAILSLDSSESLSNQREFAAPVNKNSSNSPRAIDLVNQHLREVYDRKEMERKNVENINTLTAPPLYKAPRVEPVYRFDDVPLTFDQDSMNELVGKDLGTISNPSVREKSLNEQIQEEIIDDMVRAAEKEKDKKNLAEAIIERAKQHGYLIEIDEDYKVKSVRKLSTKQEPSIFDPNSLPNR